MNLTPGVVQMMGCGMVCGWVLGWLVLTWLRTERKVRPTKRKEHSMFERFKELPPGYTVTDDGFEYSIMQLVLKHNGKRVGTSRMVGVYGLRKCHKQLRKMAWDRHDLRLDGQTKPAPKAKPTPDFKAVTLTAAVTREDTTRQRFYGTPPAYDFTHTQPITTDKED